MYSEYLYEDVMEKIQKTWEDNEALLSERHKTLIGIRSSQIAALVAFLIEIGVINYNNVP